MKISSSLLKPYLEQIHQEFTALSHEVAREANSDLATLQAEILCHLDQIEHLQNVVMTMNAAQETRVPADIYENYKKLKLSLRFAKRTFLRFVSNQERVRKMQERRSHVAIFAA